MKWVPFTEQPITREGRYLLASANLPGREQVLDMPMDLNPRCTLDEIDAFAHGRRPYPRMLDPEQAITHWCLPEPPKA